MSAVPLVQIVLYFPVFFVFWGGFCCSYKGREVVAIDT